MKNTSLAELLKNISSRAPDAHKGSFGRLQIIAGSRAYPGSAILSCLGAFKAGSGYVYLQSAARSEVLVAVPEVIAQLYIQATACVFGPGLGKDLPRQRAKLKVFSRQKVPILLDGDALTSRLKLGAGPYVLTPHPAEAARLLGWNTERVQNNRNAAAAALSKKFAANAVIVLKGFNTIVQQGGLRYINASGTVAMATAGQGDLLSGIIGSFLAQGIVPFYAAALGVYWHGRAADLLAKKNKIDRGVLAHEMAAVLPLMIARNLKRKKT